MKKPVIEFNEVSFMYEKDLVLNKVSLSIKEGEFIALIGDNGAGKSTLLKCLVGELSPMKGQVKLFGQNSTHFNQFDKVGYVAQTTTSRSINFLATVQEVVMANLYSKIGLFKFPNKEHKQQVTAALQLVKMETHQKYLLNELSGGQQQRVMLARALVNSPSLMILDEPTAGIDRESSEHFYQLLSKLNQQGLTILLVTHHVNSLLPYLSRTLKLVDGQLNEIDPSQEHH